MRHACSKAALLQRRMRGSLCTQAGDERSVSLPLRPQLVCDLCGDSFGGAQLRFYLCGVSPYGAASGNRQLEQHREIVAAVLRQLVCDLCGDSGGAQQLC